MSANKNVKTRPGSCPFYFEIKNWYVKEIQRHLKKIILVNDSLPVTRNQLEKYKLGLFYKNIAKMIEKDFRLRPGEKNNFFNQPSKDLIANHIREILPEFVEKEWVGWLNRHKIELGQDYPYSDKARNLFKNNCRLIEGNSALDILEKTTSH